MLVPHRGLFLCSFTDCDTCQAIPETLHELLGPYMNYLDSLILFDLALIYRTFSSGAPMLRTITIQIATLISAFIIIMVIKVMYYSARFLLKCTCSKFVICKLVSLRMATFPCEEEQQLSIDTPTAQQSLVEATSTTISYGTCTTSK